MAPVNMSKRPLEELKSVLVWFRADLRIHDNPALIQAIEFASAKNTQLIAASIISLAELKQMGVGPIRVDFHLRTLQALQQSLKDIGIPLHVKVVEEGTAADIALINLCHEFGCGQVFFNNESDPIGQARDVVVRKTLSAEGIDYQASYDQCIVREGLVLSKAQKPYGMFTPFKNTWLAYIKDNPIKLLESPGSFKGNQSLIADPVPSFIKGYELPSDFDRESLCADFPAGEAAALSAYTRFLEERGKSYKDLRNFPATNGTSKISPYLAIGALSPRTAFELARKANNGHTASGSEGLQTFISELCWRDFYRHIILHFPQVIEGKPFKAEAANIEWREGEQAESDFEKWCQGRTGYPIVDAAMRQLTTTGWMHNRLRMIVSMFLTKHLLISWKRGETWFAQHLIDYDYPSNNGGWQWSSSTGTDSQPYFRIFNPFTQSENFDKEGKFIRKFVPELAKVSAPAIHNPSGVLSKAERAKLCPSYPDIIVQHTFARNRALEVFKKAFKKL